MLRKVKEMLPKKVQQWFQDQNAMARKSGGLAEKEASIQVKMDAAMSILAKRRKEVIHVDVDRRLDIDRRKIDRLGIA